ncbi:hypothetical protein GCM10009541_22970 [Micromonospora gifhornensis]|uniref:Uncharacterized protein n=1 Tax=Micromonospora gifhornensis TaxID=84594 RepID=A0ABQ4IHF1_9ACTN|nr:hypothetical protein Vgi01_40060 [Micromonospora gifhornensis]
MQRLGPELDDAQRVTPGEILSGPVVLQHGVTTANRRDGMQTINVAGSTYVIETVTHLRRHGHSGEAMSAMVRVDIVACHDSTC